MSYTITTVIDGELITLVLLQRVEESVLKPDQRQGLGKDNTNELTMKWKELAKRLLKLSKCHLCVCIL